MRMTPENITQLNHNEMFVFGSNEAGRHGAGAALAAKMSFGAEYGLGFGPSGKSFAIPTKDWFLEVLPLEDIKHYVDRFYYFALYNPRYHFLITEIGCGLAGYSPEDIAPLFKGFLHLKNISLPKRFLNIIAPTLITSHDGDDIDDNDSRHGYGR